MNKTVFITGSTDGIGKLTALKLATDGHTLILHGRSEEKLQNVISEVKTQTGNGNVSGFIGDLSNFDSIRGIASEIIRTIPKIDVLINNAGIFNSPETITKDGLDIRFVVNYLAPVLLTELLLPVLEKGKNPKIINLSSAAQAPVSIDSLLGKNTLSSGEAYAQSKLALTMWSFDLANELNEIQVIAVNPGSLLNTKMVKEAYGRHWSPIDKGADILIELAISDKYGAVSGKYFDNDQGSFGPAHPDASNQAKTDELLDITKKLLANQN